MQRRPQKPPETHPRARPRAATAEMVRSRKKIVPPRPRPAILRALPCALFFTLALPTLSFAQSNTTTTQNPPLDTGATAWMLTSTALVLLMVPGLGMFYGGLVRTKNVLGTMMHSFAAMAIIGVLWAAVGYAIAFGPNVLHGFCGFNPGMLFLAQDSNAMPINNGAACIPELVYAMFQGKFAIITPALIAGAFAERVRFRGYCVFIALWGLIVYCPLAHWVWAPDGFLNLMGAQDYAGGTVVHISAGISALRLRRLPRCPSRLPPNRHAPKQLGDDPHGRRPTLGRLVRFQRRLQRQQQFRHRPRPRRHPGRRCRRRSRLGHHRSHPPPQSHQPRTLLRHPRRARRHHPRRRRRLRLRRNGPGALASLICYFTVIAKSHLGYDDSLDVFGIHGIAGIFGAIFLSLFLRHASAVDLANRFGPNWSVGHQFLVQCTAVGIAIAYAATLSIVLVIAVDKTVGFRLDPVRESAGMDHALHGEHGYGLINLQ